MANEINTVGAIQDKFGSYWVELPRSQCLTKLEILGSNVFTVNGDYGNTECPRMDDIAIYHCVKIKPIIASQFGTQRTYKAVASSSVNRELNITITVSDGTVYVKRLAVTIPKGETESNESADVYPSYVPTEISGSYSSWGTYKYEYVLSY